MNLFKEKKEREKNGIIEKVFSRKMNSLSITVHCGACRCNTHGTHETAPLFLERDISIKQEFSPLSSQSLARACLNLDLRSGSGDQDTPSMLVLTEKGPQEKGKRERALYGKQEFSRKNKASQCLRTIERPLGL
jgi:hypothetical protein